MIGLVFVLRTGSLPYRQLRKCDAFINRTPYGSLPYRQLRNVNTDTRKLAVRSLPYRQLRKMTK